MNAWPTILLSAALMATAAWGNSQRVEARSLRAELDRTTAHAERSDRQTAELSQRLADLEDHWRTLSVVHQVLDLSPPLAPEEPRRVEAPAAVVPARVAATPATQAAVPTLPDPESPSTLSINSIPPSTCLIDGKPIGTTPQIRVQVSPGRHVVQFVTPEVSTTVPVSVAAGETKPVTAKLDKPQPVASGYGF